VKKILAVLLVLAAPVAAQTGDCTAETGTSTTWEVVEASEERVRIRYTFYSAGVWGRTDVTRPSSIAPGTDLTEFADSQCLSVDESRNADELLAARSAICSEIFADANPENTLPAYPEVIATDSNAPTIEEARQRNWHRQLIREVWPETTIVFSNCALNLWQWVNTQQTVVGRREWWQLTIDQDGEANSRLGGLAGAESIFEQDRQYLGTDLDGDY
jgi:hypothetical protein